MERQHTPHAVPTPSEVLGKLKLRAVLGDPKAAPVDPLVQVGGADILGKWYFGASWAAVSACDELRQVADEAAGKTTKHVEFDVQHFPALEWRTADNLEVLPRSSDEDVAWFAERLGAAGQLDSSVTFVRAAGVEKAERKPFPSPCTLRDALTLYCDLASLTKNAVRHFAALVTDDDDRAALEHLLQDTHTLHWLSSEGVHLTLRELFELYLASAEVDVSGFLQLCPRQRSRPYTIASSSREDSHHIGICVSMVQEGAKSLKEIVEELQNRGHRVPRAAACLERAGGVGTRCFRGLCSSMLCTRIEVGDKLWINARASSFRLPKRSTIPIVMIAAGTGLAPFRGFLREFRAEKGVRQKTVLFFGCTREKEDFIYRDEILEALELQPPALKELVTAFSREQPEKVYVQHRLRERSAQISEFIAAGGYVYICGGTAMGKAIREELARCLDSADQVQRLLNEGRIVEELW